MCTVLWLSQVPTVVAQCSPSTRGRAGLALTRWPPPSSPKATYTFWPLIIARCSHQHTHKYARMHPGFCVEVQGNCVWNQLSNKFSHTHWRLLEPLRAALAVTTSTCPHKHRHGLVQLTVQRGPVGHQTPRMALHRPQCNIGMHNAVRRACPYIGS